MYILYDQVYFLQLYIVSPEDHLNIVKISFTIRSKFMLNFLFMYFSEKLYGSHACMHAHCMIKAHNKR